MFEDQNCKNFFHFDKFKMKKKKYVVLLLPFFILLVSISYYIDTHRENTPSNKTAVWICKIKVWIYIFWAIGNLMMAPFRTPHSVYLKIGFWQGNFVWKYALSFIVPWTKKSYSSFLKKVLVFQKTCFKVNILKTFKIQCDYHRKTCQSLEQRAL